MLKYTFIKFFIIASVSLFSLFEANSAVNLYLNHTTRHDLAVSAKGPDIYEFTTLDIDPYMSTTGLQRNLMPEECVLQFEYKASADIRNFILYFGPIYTDKKILWYGTLPATESFNKAEIDITKAITEFDYGSKNSILRMDFGSIPDIDIAIRNLRITTPGDESEWKYDNSLPTIDDILGKGLPVIEIWTENEEEPTCDVIAPPEGCMGSGITNAIKVPGSLKIYESDGTLSYDSGDYVKSEAGMTIKVRGNTSASLTPKPFKIKLQKKADLLRRGNKDYNDKNWVLLQDCEMKLFTGFIVNDALKLDWTPQSEYVSVIVNGFYRGVYLLAEGVERNTDSRINVSKTGFIAELDPYWWNEDGAYLSSETWNPSMNYTLKYPEFEDAEESQIEEIHDALKEYEKSIADGTYDDIIDCESFARALLAQDILGIEDWCGSNMYFTKYDNTVDSKLRRPTLWDFDSSESTPDTWSNPHKFYYTYLLNSKNRTFQGSFIDLWNNEGLEAIDNIINSITGLRESEKLSAYNDAVALTNTQFGKIIPDGEEALDRALDWYVNRKEWLTNAMADLEEKFIGTSVNEIPVSDNNLVIINGDKITSVDGNYFQVYTLQGICLTPDSSGVKEITIPDSGIYIIVSGEKSMKIKI